MRAQMQKAVDGVAPDAMNRDEYAHMEDTPAYAALNAAGLLCTKHRRRDIEDIKTNR